MLRVNDQNLNWGYLFSLFLFHILNGFVGASSLYALLCSISNAHNVTWWAYLVFETLEPDKKDSATPLQQFLSFWLLPLNHYSLTNLPMHSSLPFQCGAHPPSFIRNLWVRYCSGYCHWIRLAMTYHGWSNTTTIGWPLFKWLTACQIISIERLIIASDWESSQNIGIIAVVSGLVVRDPVLLSLKADKK